MEIAFIGYGEAARAFRASLAESDPALRFRAYDKLLESEPADGPCATAMNADGVIVEPDPKALSSCDIVISAVTADQSLQAATDACAWLMPGRTFLDINSVSPERKRESAARVEATGATYVDMAVMAPVHPKGHRTAVLLAGPVSVALRDGLSALGFSFEVVGAEVGRATAIKMVRSLFVKGLEAITVEALLAAHASGCLDEIMASLSGSYPGLGWPEFAEYEFERTTHHGLRRAAEMRESAATLRGLGLHGALGDAIADVQDAMGAAGRVEEAGLAATIAVVLKRRLGQA